MTIVSDAKDITRRIKSGEVGIVPTDTVYGLVCDASNKAAVKRLYGLKNRDNKPGTVISSSVEKLTELGIKKRYLTAVEHYWPNPISIVIPCGTELRYLHQGKNSLAVRIPQIAKNSQFISSSPALLSSSANLPGQPPATNVEQASGYFGDKVDFYVDAGEVNSQSSTVLEVIDDAVNIIREGAVKINEDGSIKNEL